MKWSGSVAIITGASRGIGAAVARAAAARGARVGLIARSKADLEAVLGACEAPGAIAAADVAERVEVEEAIASLERELGPTGILVNNAGIGSYGSVAGTEVEIFEKLMRVNYLGTIYPTKAVLPGMLERKNGHIVNIASIVARLGAPLEAAYSATKFAVAGLTEALAMELHAKGIGVSMIHPGPVDTDFFDARGVPYRRKFPKPVSPDAVAALVIKAVERDKAEQYIPRWLRFPVAMKVLAPSLYRKGTLRDFRDELR